jgi:predicted dehydrogenase
VNSLQTCAQQQHDTVPHRAGKRLRAAVIGLGVGEAHIAGYAGHPACDVVALCDFSNDRLREVGARHPATALRASADEILDDPDIDVVSIASYDNFHYEQIIKAITNGKHVFVEKPLCLREAEARHIRDVLRANPRVRLSSNLILRRSPRFIALKERIDRGLLGELFLVEGDYHYGRLHKITEGWRGSIDFYSVVYGGAIHIVDLLLWLTGRRIVEVAAYGNQIASRGSQFRYNDTVVSVLKFENGLIGKAGVSYGCVRPHFHGLSVYGTAGTFVNGQPDGWLYESRDPKAAPQRVDDPYPAVQKGDLIASFVESIVSGSKAIVGEEDVFRTMSVCLAIEKAVATGSTCAVEYI